MWGDSCKSYCVNLTWKGYMKIWKNIVDGAHFDGLKIFFWNHLGRNDVIGGSINSRIIWKEYLITIVNDSKRGREQRGGSNKINVTNDGSG